MKILIPGGHLTPALAFVDWVQTVVPDTEFVAVIREFSQESTKQKSAEHSEFQKRNVPTFYLHTVKSTQLRSLLGVFHIARFIKSCWDARVILKQTNPQIVLSFGGYVSVPVVIAAWFLQIPVIVHEQTSVVGWATKLSLFFARAVAVSYSSVQTAVSHPNTHLIGTPLRPALLEKSARPIWVPKNSLPILFVTGGSQGSLAINSIISEVLLELTNAFVVIHQCGKSSKEHNYSKELNEVRKKLPAAQQDRYCIREWVSQDELAWILSNASKVVSRAGANTLAELQAFGVPAVVIPLPFSLQNEQTKNAEIFVEQGGGVLLPQSGMSAESLLQALAALPDRSEISLDTDSFELPSKKMFELVSKTVSNV